MDDTGVCLTIKASAVRELLNVENYVAVKQSMEIEEQFTVDTTGEQGRRNAITVHCSLFQKVSERPRR